VLAAVALVAPLPFVGKPGLPNLLIRELENFCHPVVFALLAMLLARAGLSRLSIALLLLVFGAASELLQQFTGRDASTWDFLRDCMGTSAGLAIASLHESRPSPPRPRSGTRILILLVAGIALAPLAWTFAAYGWRALALPVIWNRSDPLLRAFGFEAEGQYPGLAVVEPHPDWRRFRELLITVRNTGASSATVVVRVADVNHDQRYTDRFNRDFAIDAENTATLRISLADIALAPAGRRMDMKHVSDVLVFQRLAHSHPRVQVTDIRLSQ